MERKSIPPRTADRLPLYYNYLTGLKPKPKHISSAAIAEALGLGGILVRKDLAAVSAGAKPRIGYETASLIADLGAYLGCGKTIRAVVIGADRLGRALLSFERFSTLGVDITAVFDTARFFDSRLLLECSPEERNAILPLEQLEVYCRSRQVKIGIITVQDKTAQEICDRLVSAGVGAIWNFAPTPLKVPEGVILKNEDLAGTLALMAHELSEYGRE